MTTVICCRPDEPAGSAGEATRSATAAILGACAGLPIEEVGPRPGKGIDALLSGRILVVGDDADLAAVVLRLLRRDLLGVVQVAYAAPAPTAVTGIWGLPTGAAAVQEALRAEVDLVPLVRDDAGGVLMGTAQLGPLPGPVYVDERRVVGGAVPIVQVEPDRVKGLAVTVVRRRFVGFGRRPATTLGRAVEFAISPATVIVRDGVRFPRQVRRWVFYKHTEPLRLVRGLY